MGGPSEELPEAGSAGTPRANLARSVAVGLLGAAILVAILYAVATRRSPICVAAHNTLSGPSRAAGLEAVEAMELYVDEANRRGGVNGHRIELVRIDDEGS